MDLLGPSAVALPEDVLPLRFQMVSKQLMIACVYVDRGDEMTRDDLVEPNRRMNALLEHITKAAPSLASESAALPLARLAAWLPEEEVLSWHLRRPCPSLCAQAPALLSHS